MADADKGLFPALVCVTIESDFYAALHKQHMIDGWLKGGVVLTYCVKS